MLEKKKILIVFVGFLLLFCLFSVVVLFVFSCCFVLFFGIFLFVFSLLLGTLKVVLFLGMEGFLEWGVVLYVFRMGGGGSINQ